MKSKKNSSIQEWLPFDKILDNGIIKLKGNDFIKIIKVIPINFNLKSNLEKEAILNSYKLFLKTCNFDIQILIQSKKEDLSKNISQIQEINTNEKNFKITKISEQYIDYIQNLNQRRKSSSKNFFILLKYSPKNLENIQLLNIEQELNEKIFKVKECLSRCGNYCIPINNKNEIRVVLNDFFNKKREV